jgi:hypothetical protein
MGSASPQRVTVEPGCTLIADVVTTGAVRYAPRNLRLSVAAAAVCVRRLDGQLLWLETNDSCAFTGPDGHVQTGALLPRDTAAEAKALVDLPAALAWSAATLAEGTQPQVYERRPADLRTATTTDGRQLTLTVDRTTGVVLALAGSSRQGPFEVKLESIRVVHTTPDHFAFRHL